MNGERWSDIEEARIERDVGDRGGDEPQAKPSLEDFEMERENGSMDGAKDPVADRCSQNAEIESACFEK